MTDSPDALSGAGYVKLYRQLLGSDVFQDPVLLKVFVWSLLKASWKDRTVSWSTGRGNQLVALKRGQFITGRHAAAQELNINAGRARRALNTLSRLGVLTLKPASHYTIVTVANFTRYQDAAGDSGQATARQRPGNGQATATNKKGKKFEKGKNFSASCLQENNPPPPPPPTPHSPAGEPSWEVVEAELSKEITDFDTPLRAARKHVGPSYVLRVIEHYRAAGGKYGPGALHSRIRRSRPGIAPEEGWAPPRSSSSPQRKLENENQTQLFRIVRAMRKRGCPSEDIKATLRKKLPEEFCAASGW